MMCYHNPGVCVTSKYPCAASFLGICLQVLLIVGVRIWIVCYQSTRIPSLLYVVSCIAARYVPETRTRVYACIHIGIRERRGRFF